MSARFRDQVHLIRMALVFAGGLAIFLLARVVLVPADFGLLGEAIGAVRPPWYIAWYGRPWMHRRANRELDALEAHTQQPGKQMGEGGLAHAGQVLDKEVPARQQAGQCQADLFGAERSSSPTIQTGRATSFRMPKRWQPRY